MEIKLPSNFKTRRVDIENKVLNLVALYKEQNKELCEYINSLLSKLKKILTAEGETKQPSITICLPFEPHEDWSVEALWKNENTCFYDWNIDESPLTKEELQILEWNGAQIFRDESTPSLPEPIYRDFLTREERKNLSELEDTFTLKKLCLIFKRPLK